MTTSIGKGVLQVGFDKDQIGRDLHHSIDEGSRKAEGGIGSTFKRLAGVASAAFAGVQVFSFFKDSVEGAREANKVAAQTEAVITSTGAAAGVTAKEIASLAGSISRKTGIDDEQIQSAENLLLTFTNLKNGVGEGNDIFNQATQAAVDMGAALGGDASSNAIQLGKALNDPIRGISALTRVGVTFTEEQRNLIKTLQESGDAAGAQKVILAELNKEFGGSAEATATAGSKFSVFWGDLQENVGGFLIPLMDTAAEWAMTTLPDAFGVLQDTVGPILESFAGVIGEFWGALTTGFTEDEGTDVENFALVVRDGIILLIGALQAVASFVTDTLVPALVGLGTWLWDNKPILEGVAVAIGVVLVGAFVSWAASALAAAAATLIAMAPIILIGIAIALLVAAVIYAYQEWDWFRTTVDTVATFLKDTLWPVLQDIGFFLFTTFVIAIGLVVAAWQAMEGPVTTVKDVMVDLFDKMRGPFHVAMIAHNVVMGAALGIWTNLKGPLETILNLLIRLVGTLIDVKTKAQEAGAALTGMVPGSGGGPIPAVVGGALFGVPGALMGAFGFAEGGAVPGPVGMPQLAVVHGGELVLTPEQQGGAGNTYQLTSGDVNIAEAEDIAVAFQRLEMLDANA